MKQAKVETLLAHPFARPPIRAATDLILRSLPTGRANARPMTGSASVSKDGNEQGLAAILRDAREGALLRMRSEPDGQISERLVLSLVQSLLKKYFGFSELQIRAI
jgi:hypothetical protein